MIIVELDPVTLEKISQLASVKIFAIRKIGNKIQIVFDTDDETKINNFMTTLRNYLPAYKEKKRVKKSRNEIIRKIEKGEKEL